MVVVIPRLDVTLCIQNETSGRHAAEVLRDIFRLVRTSYNLHKYREVMATLSMVVRYIIAPCAGSSNKTGTHDCCSMLESFINEHHIKRFKVSFQKFYNPLNHDARSIALSKLQDLGVFLTKLNEPRNESPSPHRYLEYRGLDGYDQITNTNNTNLVGCGIQRNEDHMTEMVNEHPDYEEFILGFSKR